MSRRRKATTRSPFTATYDALTLAFERHEALTLMLHTHLETLDDGDKCEDDGIRGQIFAASVLASVLHEQSQTIRDLGRALWGAATTEHGGAR